MIRHLDVVPMSALGRKRATKKYMYVVRNVLIQAKFHSIRLLFEADQGRKSLIYIDVGFSK
ncbi:MAG: hypothetical protein ACI95C_001620 [Pseudohongiellaceae bacterium]|jgi:hypothetical protein